MVNFTRKKTTLTTRRRSIVKRRTVRKRTQTINPKATLRIGHNKDEKVIPDKMEVYLRLRYGQFVLSGILPAGFRYFDIKLNSPSNPHTSAVTNFSSIGGIFPTSNVGLEGTLINTTANTTGLERFYGSAISLYRKCRVLSCTITVNLITKSAGDFYYAVMIPWNSIAGTGGTWIPVNTPPTVSLVAASEQPYASRVALLGGYRDLTSFKKTYKMHELLGMTPKEYMAYDAGLLTSGITQNDAWNVRIGVAAVDATVNTQSMACDVTTEYHCHFEEPNDQLAQV